MILVLCAAAASSTRTLGGTALARRLFVAGLIVNVAVGVWMGWTARTAQMTAKQAALAWFIISGGACTAIVFYGAFSPVGLMVAVFAVFFVGMRGERTVAIMVYAILASFHAALVTALAGGRFRELGVLPYAASDGRDVAVTELLIELVLFAALIVAGAIRRSMVSAVRDLEEQARTTGRHELMLEDARRAFEAALRATGGGRFSHQLVGAYRLGGLLGEGAMGEVYHAIDTRTGGAAAVKLLRRSVMEDRGIVQRFLTEARIVRSLHTDHVARVLETAEADAALPYIAMERLHGCDLRKHVTDHPDGRLPLAEADDLLRQIARGIDALHRAGVVHRDLKPSNLFRTDAGTWKILDFGVSKVLGEHTAENAIVGTPNFMSPEQATRGAVDGRADIFALGAILYYAITGRLAFDGETLAQIALRVAHHEPPPPGALVSGIPAGVDAAVMTALAKRPRDRFATAAAFSEAFGDALARRDEPAPAAPRDGLARHSTTLRASRAQLVVAAEAPGDAGEHSPGVPALAPRPASPAPGAARPAPVAAGSRPRPGTDRTPPPRRS